MSKINEARQKITEEALKINGTLATFVEEAINKLVVDDKAAEAVLDKRKSLSGCMKKIMDEARKRAANNVACLSSINEVALQDAQQAQKMKLALGQVMDTLKGRL